MAVEFNVFKSIFRGASPGAVSRVVCVAQAILDAPEAVLATTQQVYLVYVFSESRSMTRSLEGST
jgi:hypothetical protein